MIRPIFHNIQNAVQAELFKATQSIKIAVAWFTNDLLFQVLLLKLETGVSVEIVLNDDDINRNSENHLEFDVFINAGGKLHWAKGKKLMHQKFCIIDDNVVINGSYNWTYKAECNDENIMIFVAERDVVIAYCEEFQKAISNIPIEQKKINDEKQETATQVDSLIEEKHIVESVKKLMDIPDGVLLDDIVSNRLLGDTSPYDISPYPDLHFYDEIHSFSRRKECVTDRNSEFIVAQKNNKYAFVDEQTLLPITPFIFSKYQELYNGTFEVTVDGKYGIFDLDKLDFVIIPFFDIVDITKCSQAERTILSEHHLKMVKYEDKLGILDVLGNVYLPCEYNEILVKDKYHYVAKKGEVIYNITIQ